jgi:exopolysaccharide production protein ExoZ
MSERLLSIQALRGVAVLLVVLVHTRHFELRVLGTSAIPEWGVHLQAGVDLFFVISGYLMVAVTRRRGLETPHPLRFLARRAIRIIPLYWLVTLIVAALMILLPSLGPRRTDSILIEVVRSLAFWPGNQAPLVGQGWSLIHEMYFYIVFSVSLILPLRKSVLFLFAWAFITGVGGVVVWSPPVTFGPWVKVSLHPLTFEFLAGALLAITHREGWLRWWRTAFFIAILSAIACAQLPELERDGFLRPFCYGLPAILLLHAAVCMEKKIAIFPPRYLVLIGDASYSIYLWHILAIFGFGWVWVWGIGFPASGPSKAGLFFSLSVLAVVSGVFSWLLIERPLHQKLSRWWEAKYPERCG